MSPVRHPPVEQVFDLSGGSVLVTGGAGGLGRALVTRFVEAGARVAFTFHRNGAGARTLQRRLRAKGGVVHAIACDLRSYNAVSDMLNTVGDIFGSLSTLVNNAGIYPVSTLHDISETQWHDVLQTNLTAAHYCTQLATALLRAGDCASVINIASIEASESAPGHAHYGATKAGLVMYSRSAALELGVFGIRVNSVSPGLIARRGLAGAWPQGIARYCRAAPLSRIGHATEVADVCLFLASPAARWVSGANIVVDGGVSTTSSY